MRTLLLAFLGGLIGCSMLKAPSESHIEFGANGAVSNSSFPLMVGTRDKHGVVQVSKHALDVNPATPWQWASVTKQFIAVLVMQDVEAGRLALSDTLAQRLPRFSKDREDVTVEHLLRHFSGLGKPEALPKTMETDPLTFCDLPVQAKPGAQFDYNNCDTAIAAAILEEVNGKPWAELLEERILKPLGMNSSGVLVAPSENGDVITSGAPHLYGASAAMYGSMEDL
ncbi:MAG: serine hydrolase domain-containing protein, partial [Myxococcota bacterium]